MKRIILFLAFILSFQFSNHVFAKPSSSTVQKPHLKQAFGQIPLSFESNQGQVDESVKFLSRGNGYGLYLTPTEAVLVLSKQPGYSKPDPKVQSSAIRMKFVGGNPETMIVGEDKLTGKTNYFIGNDANKWQKGIPNFKKVRYLEVYPGIDLVFYGNQRKLEYDFVVKPGADPNLIQLSFEGADRLSIESGDLVLHTSGGDIFQKAPVIYQEINEAKSYVHGKYLLAANNNVSFRVDDYDESKNLIIDPILEYSTYLGGSSRSVAWAIAVDSSGSAYITGRTFSNFPTTGGSLQTSSGGGAFPGDAFVTKLSADGLSLEYSTFLGGSSGDEGKGIAVDTNGNAFIVGQTESPNFPTEKPYQPIIAGGVDAFVTKLSADGSMLEYSTYLGGSNDELDQLGARIAVDQAGCAHVVGNTESSNFPTEAPFQGSNIGQEDAFITKFSSDGSSLEYSTYLGGSLREVGRDIAVDSSGNAMIIGHTLSTDFPTQSALQSTLNGGQDIFLAKFNDTGSLIFSTYLGGSSGESGHSIALDLIGDAYITGETASDDFPTTLNAFQTTKGDATDLYVTKITSDGSAIEYSTFLGGSSTEIGLGIDVDPNGNAVVTGRTDSNDFPLEAPIQALKPGGVAGGIDGFVARFNSTGDSLIYSTYLGGINIDWGIHIRADDSHNAYISGLTRSGDFPTENAYQDTKNASVGINTGFVAKISDPDETPPDFTFTQLETELSPPNHKLILVATVSDVTDLVDPDPDVLVTVTSNQPIDGPGDGNSKTDWQVVQDGDTWKIFVRAERAKKQGTRIYDISVTVTDIDGNSSTASGSVSVS